MRMLRQKVWSVPIRCWQCHSFLHQGRKSNRFLTLQERYTRSHATEAIDHDTLLYQTNEPDKEEHDLWMEYQRNSPSIAWNMRAVAPQTR
jgi:hypothetical protein